MHVGVVDALLVTPLGGQFIVVKLFKRCCLKLLARSVCGQCDNDPVTVFLTITLCYLILQYTSQQSSVLLVESTRTR